MKRYLPKNSIIPTVDSSPYKKISASEVTTIPERSVVLEDMLKVAWVEVGRLKKKQEAGISLDAKEVRTLTGLIDAVTKLSKEQRETDKGWKPEDLSDEEALIQLGEAYDALKKKLESQKAKEGRNEGKSDSK
jgi:hypothetical protein